MNEKGIVLLSEDAKFVEKWLYEYGQGNIINAFNIFKDIYNWDRKRQNIAFYEVWKNSSKCSW